MQIVPRSEIALLLRRAGLDSETREFACETVCRLTVKEAVPPVFTKGPHRKVTYPDGRVEGPFPVADRPALSQFIAEALTELEVLDVLALVPDGAFWLNNKAQSQHLHDVADAQTVAKFLRSRGLTNRFQGGFRIEAPQFAAVIPRLAAQTYAGGADVLFVSLDRRCPLTALACHHFDIHFSAPDPAAIAALARLAESRDLLPDTLSLPDLPDVPVMWE